MNCRSACPPSGNDSVHITISAGQAQAIAGIGRVSQRDPGGRGFSTNATINDLQDAALALLASQRIVVVTGFCIRAAMIGENDGPPGALDIADALLRLGKEVCLLTDRHSSGLLAAGSEVFQQRFRTIEMSPEQDAADAEIDDLLTRFSPTHIVAIERPGSAIDGHRYSMRGEILDDVAPAADRLLRAARQVGCRSIAIGDGGNELGMGSLRDRLKTHVQHGELIFCATEADYVIPAGISNWGGYALVAALSIAAGKMLLRTPDEEHALLAALFTAGAVDGCVRKPSMSVDGIVWDDYAKTLEDIYRATRDALA